MKDYCESCEEFIEQIEIDTGEYCCPICKTNNNITTFYKSGEDD